ncbi:hypothetical protein [Algoriphagus formosus]|jgi:uncharacterized membrane protein YsdA (DUF1294 family)|uniref:Uncharacterized protein n=2 Tax=Algoriphagus TaxID=246875 RepID=A0A0P7XE93_9BACT|nr:MULTISPECIES: hypothetical protein [Algoriphagus]KPQ13726.1 MAG: hypothetical protein HLUCCX10_12180 [Algoriphagus marincola HL-49]TDK49545.1 hypothetical protein E1898_02955 [Algoriphagus aquimaris]
MKWTDLPEGVLLQRSFLFGIVGIILATLSIFNTQFKLVDAPMGPLNGVAMLLQFFGLSLAIMVMRKRKVKKEDMEKAKVMTLVLGVALLFFILSL